MAVESSLCPQSVVILGSGIIGLTTAHGLLTEWEALVQAKSTAPRPKVTIIEPSNRPSPAASSQATGGLGDFGFAPETAPLGVLSFQLHAEFADFARGRERYQYTRQTVFRVTPNNFTGVSSPPDTWGPSPPVDVSISSLPTWLKTQPNWTAQRLATAPNGAHIDSAEFCAWMYEGCKKLGVNFAFSSNVTSIALDTASQRFKSVQVQQPDGTSRTLPCDALVIAAGPWSDRVFSSLFPSARIKLPFHIEGSAGHHFRVRTPGWTPWDTHDVGSQQVFPGNVMPGNDSLDITSFPNGQLYVGGYGAIPEPLPDLADAVEPQPSKIQAMVQLTRQFLGVPQDQVLEISDVGRAYRPRAVPNHPIITKIDWDLLGVDKPAAGQFSSQIPMVASDKSTTGCTGVVGGLFINTGHHSDGLTLSLGSGKVMGELLLGREPSVDISGLGLPQT
ncbi:FAD dependent oxidoreductase [Stachybotrys elegans]|uniref:FAD dependent oxidoreductase n=1 Tax=Stachybotrys elegans TaxID=80388 RepID=A0A8K0SPN7_9HYPO|nr:FAD dependent oxidoreductase [Stachybotrys elegans]